MLGCRPSGMTAKDQKGGRGTAHTCTVKTEESLLSARESAFLPNSLLACMH